MAKKSKSEVGFDYLSSLHESIDDISRRQNVDVDLMEVIQPMSTGFLALDMSLGGGIRPAMYTNAGHEQTAKTTSALEIVASAVKQKLAFIALWDAEGSSRNSIPYIRNILKGMGVTVPAKELFGIKDKDGNWIVKPTVRYTSDSSGERFFNWLAAILREMPDKKYVAKEWWLVYDDNKKNKARVGEFADSSMAKKYGRGLWVKAPDGNLQGLIVVDSWPTLNPDSNDDEEADNSLGVMARFFAKHLPRLKGKLARKMVAIQGINQLREIPMAMYGPKEKEACGNALRLQSDARNWFISRASGMPFVPVFDKDEGYEIENSVEFKGKDRYRYVQVKNIKNKLSAPKRKFWIRIWAEDGNGDARGLDPFFDCVHYLKETGQLSGNRKKLILNLHDLGKSKKPVDWFTLKRWVLGTKDDKIKISKSLGYKPFDLRSFCFKQIRSGVAETLYTESKNTKVKDEE